MKSRRGRTSTNVEVNGKSLIYSLSNSLLKVGKTSYPIDIKLEAIELAIDKINQCKAKTIESFRWTNPDLKSFRCKSERIGVLFAISNILLHLKVVNSRKLWSMFPSLPNICITRIRESLAVNSLTYQYKCAILECLRLGYTKRHTKKIMEVFTANGLSPSNFLLYYIVLDLVSAEDITSNLKDPDQSINYYQMNAELKALCSDPYNYKLCKYHTAKKLSFVCNSSGITIDDMANDVYGYFLITFQQARYWKSYSHSSNYARASAKTIILRIIHAYTHYPQKTNMWEIDGKYYHRESSLDEVSELMASSDMTGNLLITESTGFTVEDQVHSRLDSDRWLSKISGTSLKDLTAEEYEFLMSLELD